MVTLDELKLTQNNKSINDNLLNSGATLEKSGDDDGVPEDVILDQNKVPNLNPVVEFKKPRELDLEDNRDKYDKIVTE